MSINDFKYSGVQSKNNAYHNVNKVQNQGIYEWIFFYSHFSFSHKLGLIKMTCNFLKVPHCFYCFFEGLSGNYGWWGLGGLNFRDHN
jgi:hypothetical protein